MPSDHLVRQGAVDGTLARGWRWGRSVVCRFDQASVCRLEGNERNINQSRMKIFVNWSLT